jgi:hypothetical protein
MNLSDYKVEFEYVDHAIQGKLVKCAFKIDDMFSKEGHLTPEEKKYIKEQMAMQIALFLLENDSIEFTQMRMPYDNAIQVYGRIFVTPNEQTRIIRTLKR